MKWLRALSGAIAAVFIVTLMASDAAAYTVAPSYWTRKDCYFDRYDFVRIYVGWRRPGYYPVAYGFQGDESITYTHVGWHPNGGPDSPEIPGFTINEGGLKRDKHNISGATPSRDLSQNRITFTFARANGDVARCSGLPLRPKTVVPDWMRS